MKRSPVCSLVRVLAAKTNPIRSYAVLWFTIVHVAVASGLGMGRADAASSTDQAGAADPQWCIGDCNANGTVSVDELIKLVNIALGRATPSSCLMGSSSSAEVDIDITMIVAAVNNAVKGCSTPGERCLVASGGAAATCVKQYAAAIGVCRDAADAACEATLRAKGGTLETLQAATEEPVRESCTAAAADRLTFLLGVDDLVLRTAEACGNYGEDLAKITYPPDPGSLSPAGRTCQHVVGVQSAGLYDAVVQAYGEGCYVPEFDAQPCDRMRRDDRVAQARAAAAAAIEQNCDSAFDALGLVPPTASPTLAGRIDALMDVVVSRARELAQRVYPPFNLGPTGLFGPFPVGVHTFALTDPSRRDVTGNNPKPIQVWMYYPSTPEAVTGVSREKLFDLITPTYRDVARSPGRFPVVIFSPGYGVLVPRGYTYFAAHLASHGFLVASVIHFDSGDPSSDVANRPLDLSFVIDTLLAYDTKPGNFLEGAVDAARIGAAGHSSGGYTAMALATCPFGLGTFTDPRVTAILPLDGDPLTFLIGESPAIFSTIMTPTLLFGGTLSQYAQVQPQVYASLEPGPVVMDFANLTDATHFTFSDECEFPPTFETCQPGALPWRYARYIVDYLALNFFDATLNGNGEALVRLDPALIAAKVDDITYQSKVGGCPTGQSCNLTCAETVCGDGSVGPQEACDPPGEQGQCAAGQLCNQNCTACVACGAATVIAPEGGVVDGTTVGATSVLGTSCNIESTAPQRLFQWTPSVSHDATIQTCGGGTDFDTILYIREGTCVAPGLACNDDGASKECGSQSILTVPVVGGTTYYIVVTGSGDSAGNFTLSVE